MKSLINRTLSLGLLIVAGAQMAMAEAHPADQFEGLHPDAIKALKQRSKGGEIKVERGAVEIPASGVECKAPKSKLYKKADINDAVELELISSFSKITRGGPKVKAVLRYNEEKKDKTMIVPVFLSGRGNSRGMSCSFKPFRMTFTSKELAEKIETQLLQRGVRPNAKDYLAEYLKEFESVNYEDKGEGKAPKNGLFDDLGDDVKVVTHCGKSENGGDWPGGLTESDQDNRVMMEYYLYEILNQTKLPVEQTRLAHIKYYDAQGAAVFKTANGQAQPKIAFFREPPSSLAKRCDLLSKKPAAPPVVAANGVANVGVDRNGNVDQDSSNALTIVNKFVGNSDFFANWGDRQGHNVNYLYDKSGKRYMGAYDFDLAHAVTTQRTGPIENVVQGLKSTLNGINNPQAASIVASRFYSAKPEMEAVLAKAKLAPVYKERADKWLAEQMKVFKATIDANKAVK